MDYIKRIEYATRISLAAPNMVTPEERQEAEEVLMNFRKSKAPYHVCTTILETSTADSVQYQAAAAMKEAVIREWGTISDEVKLSLQQFVLSFITDRSNTTGFVRETLCNVLAVMLKRSSIEDTDAARRAPFYQHLTQLVASGDPMKEKTACSILSALCTEFSASDRSSGVGVTWEQHIKCKRQFEENDLCRIFDLVLQVLRHIHSVSSDTLTGSEAGLCEKVYIIAEQILCWQFSPTTYHRRSALFHDSTVKLSFKPTSSWSSVLCDPSLIQLFWQLHVKVRKQESLCHASMSCLSQLASLQGPVFSDQQQAMCYLGNFIQGFFGVYASGAVESFEALGVSNVVRNLVEANTIQTWAMLPQEHHLFPTFLQVMTLLTCNFGKCAAEESEEVDEEDQLYMEAYDNILDSWTTFIENMEDQDKQLLLAPCASHIIECFIHCHLAPPDGVRKKPNEEADIEELDENDIEKFATQLMSIAYLARMTPQTTTPLLCRMLEDRTNRLQGQLHRTQQHGSQSPTQEDSIMTDLYEDLHWIILLAGHLLADDCDGETVLMPPEIIRYSISQKATVNENMTLRVLGSPKEKVSDIPGAGQSSDYVIRLVSDVIRLSEVQTHALSSGMAGILSPQLAQDTVWFMRVWSAAYLIFPEEYYKEISPVLSSAFGRNSDGAKWLVGYMVTQVVHMFTHWGSEVDLLLETCDVLHNLVSQGERCSMLVECGDFWNFCKQFCGNAEPYCNLPNYVKQKIMTALVLAGSAKMNVYKEKYWEQTLEPLQKNYKQLVSKDWFVKAAVDENIRREVSALLILLQGVAIASRPDNSCLLFGYLSPVLGDCPKLLDVYRNFEDLVILILELFVEVTHKQMCYLKQTQCDQLYKWSLELLQAYSKHNVGKRHGDNEEDSFQDVTLLIELLTNILSKDLIDFNESDADLQSVVVVEPSADETSAADVVLYGLNIILPLVSSQLLLYPSFCFQYYKLVTFLCEIYPEKIEKLPQPMLQCFVFSLQAGLSSYGSENCKLCLEAVEGLATQCRKTKDSPTPLHGPTASFIRLVFDTLIVHAADMDLLRTAADTFYSLLCFQPQQTVQVFHQIVASQTDDSYKQRLSEAFSHLVPDLNKIDFSSRGQRSAFIKTLETIIFNIRGILCVK